MTMIELGVAAQDAPRKILVTPREGGGACACSCHPQLPTSDLHGYGTTCSCQLTAQERSRRGQQWRAEVNAYWESVGGAQQRARQRAEEDEVAAWLAGEPDVVITSYGGLAPEQWWGSVDGHSFYFRERHDCWRIELDLRPSGRYVSTWRGGDLSEEASYEPREIEEGDVIAEGVVDVAGYGSTPVQRAAFIVDTVRNYLRRQECSLHTTGLADLEQRLRQRPLWCPECGIRVD